MLSAPVQGDPGPTTLALEGTVEVAVVDTNADLGLAEGPDDHEHGEYVHAVVTAGGTRVPVELDDDVESGATFRGEVAVDDTLADALDERGLQPRAGTPIAEDSRTGRAAITAAQQRSTPLSVVSSSVTAPEPVTSASSPAPHRAFVAIMENRGGDEPAPTNARAQSLVDAMTSYWRTEAGGAITSFDIAATVRYTSTSSATDNADCGMNNAMQQWDEAASMFPRGTFSAPRTHLIVVLKESCRATIAGIATIGRSLADGGRVSTSVGNIDVSVGVHELGHNIGLGHANRRACVPLCPCVEDEYRNFYSVMGSSVGDSPPALDSAYRSYLGIARPGEIRSVVSSSRSLQLQPRGAGSGVRALRLLDSRNGAIYFVEWRSVTGRDAGASYQAQPIDTSLPTIKNRPGITVTRHNPDLSTTLFSSDVGGGEIVTSLTHGQTFVAPGGRVIVRATSSTGRVDVTVPLRRFYAPSPRIRGTVKVGRTLKAKVGVWRPRPSYRYQWYANGKKITRKGRTQFFTVTSRQKGKRITVQVTGRKTGYTTVTRTSDKTRRVKKR